MSRDGARPGASRSAGASARPSGRFSHPLFWLSLAVLVVNDHVLKGSGLCPGWLTGKLSDFTGLIVAPPLLYAALRRLRLPGSRAIACAVIGTGFAAINLSHAVANLYSDVVGGLIGSGRYVADTSDLIALIALPAGAALCRQERGRSVHAWHGWRRTGLAFVGALASVATAGFGGDDEDKGARSDAPQLRNETGHTLTLVISSTEGAGGCAVYRAERVSLLTSDAFAVRRELVLEPDAQVRLIVDATTTECGAARVLFEDGSMLHVYFRELERLEDFVSAQDPRRLDRSVVVKGEPGELELDVGEDLHRFEPSGPAPDPTCEQPELDPELDLSWTPLTERDGFIELLDRSEDDDGCLEVSWATFGADAGAAEMQRLCVPSWAFPFEDGDVLAFVDSEQGQVGRRLRITRYRNDEPERQLEIWRRADDLAGSRVRRLEPADCLGWLSSCGAYVRPLHAEVSGHDELLAPGEEVTVTTGDARETRVLLGPSVEVGWSSPDCDHPEARPGAVASLLEVRRF